MKRFPFSRRHLLRGAAAGVAATPFASLATASIPEGRPLRFLTIYTPMGQMDDWLPTGAGRNFVLSPQTESLQSVRDKLIFIRGMRSALTIDDGRDGGHQMGHYAAFCGTQGGADTLSLGISVDQEIANRFEGSTPFHSLRLGVLPSGLYYSDISHAGPSQPLPPIGNAMSVFNSLFGSFGLDDTELALQRLRRRSILDLWTSELDALNRRVGPQHAHVIEAHLEQVRVIERQLDTTVGATACTPPAHPGQLDTFYQSPGNYPVIGQQMIDLIVSAFACDLTRVASLMWHRTASTIVHTWAGATQEHHALTHDTNPDAADAELRPVYRWYTEQMAYLFQRLDEIPEGDGTLLDHTIIYWASEVGNHRSHSGFDMRVLLAGGGAAGLDTGQYLDVSSTRLAMNNLLSELVDAATGAPTSTFDEPRLETTGELSDIRV